jgi:hypothetical protein
LQAGGFLDLRSPVQQLPPVQRLQHVTVILSLPVTWETPAILVDNIYVSRPPKMGHSLKNGKTY